METISNQIDNLISDQFNNYNGMVFANIKARHDIMRKEFGDLLFLDYLIKAKAENPKPVYKIPKEYWAHVNKLKSDN